MSASYDDRASIGTRRSPSGGYGNVDTPRPVARIAITEADLAAWNDANDRARAAYRAENASDDDRLAAKRAKHAYDQRRYLARKENRT